MPSVAGQDGLTLAQETTGPEVSAEQIANQQQPLPANAQPQTYFIPRVKIAAGDLDKDKGDVRPVEPLHTRDRAMLREAEIESLSAAQEARNDITDRHGETGRRGALLDRRGSVGMRGRLR